MAWVYLTLLSAIIAGPVYWSCRTSKTRETVVLCASASAIVFALMFGLGALHIVLG